MQAKVALLAESVDWNSAKNFWKLLTENVALLAESVDWNEWVQAVFVLHLPSLSSRRAWIEIIILPLIISGRLCRSPHGERGLKYTIGYHAQPSDSRSPHGERGLNEIPSYPLRQHGLLSLSSRRAWIEIYSIFKSMAIVEVALLTESVDWNNRSICTNYCVKKSLSSRRAWIEILML